MRPDAEHDAVCASVARHALVIAPPGTGKTYLSVRLAAIIARTLLSHERVLILTFSNQARIQLEREAAQQLPRELRKLVEITNYHGFFWRQVWAYRRAIKLPLDSHIVGLRRRIEALRAVDPRSVNVLRRNVGLLESLAEQQFEMFQDERTPENPLRDRLLAIVAEEQRAGRLVFDDLGALFWSLLERFPTLDRAYKARYPVVIADEHQDASALQDAVVRRLATKRMIILADPMQLIYSFRGSRPERIQRHIDEVGHPFRLATPHRWHGDPRAGEWLLAVRHRLFEGPSESPAPEAASVIQVPYFNAMKARAREQVLRAFRDGLQTIAVLGFTNDEVAGLRDYFSRNGLYPRHFGGTDFEDAQEDIEQLPLLVEPFDVAVRVVDRIVALVPTLSAQIEQQLRNRITPDGVRMDRRVNPEVRDLLQIINKVYENGSVSYFQAVAIMLAKCRSNGHHVPRIEAARSVDATASAATTGALGLQAQLNFYAETVAATSQVAPRYKKGLFVMTAHQAKGKEFDAVIIVNASNRYLQNTPEGRRLFYVAITRGSMRWVVIRPDDNESPLLASLGLIH